MDPHVRSSRGRAVAAGGCVAVLVALAACAPSAPTASSTPAPTSAPASSVVLPTTTSSADLPRSGTATAPSAPTTSSSAEPSSPRTTEGTPSAPPRVTQRRPGWALDRIDQPERPLDGRYSVRHQGAGVTVYVVDGLFDVKNAELGGRASVGLKSGRRCALGSGIDHGLFVAGIIGGRRTGVAQRARIVSVGASSGCEGGTGDETEAQLTARLVRALDWVTAHARPPAVVNLSFNLEGPAPTLDAAVARVLEAGVTVVASAGNDGEDACQHPPAGLPEVLTVAASTRRDRDAGLNFGRCVDLYAPAEDVLSVVPAGLDPDRLVTSEGAATSWAAPFVTGAAALYLSAQPSATPAQVRKWLLDHATRGALRGDLHGSPNRLLCVRDL